MAEERFEIKIVMDAISRVAPVMKGVVEQTDKLASRLKLADATVRQFDGHMEQLDHHVSHTRDTLRSLNPTLDAVDRKMKGLSTTVGSVSKNMTALERNSAKAGAALGGLAGLIDKIEKRLQKLDTKMTEMGARKFEPKLDIDDKNAQRKIDQLLLKLATLERKRRTVKIGIEQEILDREIGEVEKKLNKIDGGADRLIEFHVGLGQEEIAKIESAQLKANELAKRRDITFTLQGEQHVKAGLQELRAEADELGQKDIGIRALLDSKRFQSEYGLILAQILRLAGVHVDPGVGLSTKEFELAYLNVEQKLARLGLKKEHVQVILDQDKSSFSRVATALDKVAERGELQFSGLSTKIRDIGIGLAIVFAEPLLSALTAVAGALTSVATAAGAAAAGLVGFAVAGASQAIPVVGILIASLTRLTFVFKTAQLAQQAKDQEQYQGVKADSAAAGAAIALKNAHQAVEDGLRSLTLAQQNLNDARAQGARTLVDLIAAEQRANLTASQSKLALAQQIGQGGGGLVQFAQLQATSDRVAANRQRADTDVAVAGGVSGLPQVQAANRAVQDAQRNLDRARESVAQAQRQYKIAASTDGRAANSLAIAMSHLTDAERRAVKSVQNFQNIFTRGGAFTKVTDPLVTAFAGALDKIVVLLKDPEILGALTGLSHEMAGALDDLVTFLTTGPVHDALVGFTKGATENIKPLESILKSILTILIDIAQAAQGPLHTAFGAIGGFFKKIADYTSSDKGQNALAKFFQDSLKPMGAFLGLFGAIIKLFAALAGAGGIQEGTRGIDDLTKSINGATKYIQKHHDQVQQFFHDAINATGEILKFFVKVGAALVKTFDPESVASFAKVLGDTVLPALVTFITTIGFVTRAILDLVNSPLGSFITQQLAILTGISFVATRLLGLLKPIASLVRGLGFLIKVLRDTEIGMSILIATGEALEVVMAVAFGPVGWALLAVAALTLLLAKLGVLDDVLNWIKHHWPLILVILGGPIGLAVALIAKNFGAIKKGVETALGATIKIISKFADLVLGVLKKLGGAIQGILPEPFKKAGSGAAEGLIAGFKTVADFFANIATWLFNHIIKPIYDYFEISSPSKLFARIGVQLIEGLIGGLTKGVEAIGGLLIDLGGKIVGGIVDGIKAAGDLIGSTVTKFIKKIPLVGKLFGGGGGGGKVDAITNFATNAVANTQKKIQAANNPIKSVDIGLDQTGQKKFAADWSIFWDGLVKRAQDGTDSIARAFREMRISSTQSVEKLYLDVRSSLADIQNSFDVRGGNVQDSWEKAFTGVEKITYAGLTYIGHQTNLALKTLGSKALDFGLTQPQPVGEHRASGGWGWVGKQGERGRDAIHAVLGRGEAVLNYAHQKVVDPALRMVGIDGLNGLFKNTRALHAGTGEPGLATGGFASQVPLTGVHAGVLSAARKIETAVPGLTVTSSTGGQHAKNSYHYLGEALDIAGPLAAMAKATNFIKSSGMLRSLTEGIHNPGLSVKFGKNVDPSFWGATTWAGHKDHIHIALAGVLGKIASVLQPKIQRITTDVHGGAGQIVQSLFDKIRGAANKNIAGAGGTSGQEAIFPGGKAQGASADVVSAFRRAIRATKASPLVQLALWEGGIVESGLKNLHYGDADSLGALQERTSIYGTAQALNPFSSALRFIREAMERLPWHGTAGQLAQAVQRSAFPARYDAVANQARKYLGKGGYAWGGYQADGGDYLVRKPTVFVAGEKGVERATFTPAAAGLPPQVLATTPQVTSGSRARVGDYSTLITSLQVQLASALNFDQAIASARGIVAALRRISTKTTGGLSTLAKRLDEVGGDVANVVGTLTSDLDTRTSRRRSRGLDEGVTLRQERSGLTQALTVDTGLVAQARRGLARATKTGDTKSAQIFKARLKTFQDARTELQQRLTDNASQVVDQVTSFFDRVLASIGRAQRLDATAGRAQNISLIDQTIATTYGEIDALRGQLEEAAKAGNQQLVQQIQDKIGELDTTFQELGVQRIQAMIDNVNKAADERSATIDRQFKGAEILGLPGATAAKLDAQRGAAQDQIGSLSGVLQDALASNQHGNNDALIKAIQAQIEDLNNQIIQYSSDRIQAVIDEINSSTNRSLAQNDVGNQLAQIGLTQQQVESGNINLATLGRPDYGALGLNLQQRGQILGAQRTALGGALDQAFATGDVAKIGDLIQQIGVLDVDIAQNTQATRDNTDAAFNAIVQQQQQAGDFLLSLNSGALAINDALGTLSGVIDQATALGILQQRAQELGDQNQGNKHLLSVLLGGFGIGSLDLPNMTGNALVPYLQKLYAQALATGALDDAQIQAVRDLISAIISGEQATIENTSAINQLKGTVAQTFSSTAWTTFRQAILNGNGGLLPQYQIPSMSASRQVSQGGIFSTQSGDRMLRTTDVKGGDGTYIDKFNTYITSPTEVLDPNYVGRKIGWAMAGTGRK